MDEVRGVEFHDVADLAKEVKNVGEWETLVCCYFFIILST